MDHDPFRPHWTHNQCGGVVTGVGDQFKCLKCNTEGNRAATVLPTETVNALEHFICHPDLEVEFVDDDAPSLSARAPAQKGVNRPTWHKRKLLSWRARRTQ